MGQSLSSAAQWTTAKEGLGRGRLEFTPTNELILGRITAFVEGFPSSHAEESKLTFKQPLVWNTELRPGDFSAGGYNQRDDGLTSEARDRSGRAVLTLQKKSSARWELSVSSIEQLEAVLRFSGAKKVSEARLCLEANPDPVAKMLGDRFATVEGADGSVQRFVDEILSSRSEGPTSPRRGRKEGGDEEGDAPPPPGTEDSGAEGEEGKEKRVALKLLMLIKDFDEKLMAVAVKKIGTELKLTPSDVERAVELLRKYSGVDPDVHVLRDIGWAAPYVVVFNNGARAPFHRQINGDIAYIVATPHDADPICVTASTHGYYVNSGVDSKTNELDFERQGEFHRDLIALLREKDAHFSETIDKKDIYEVKGKDAHDSALDLQQSRDLDRTDGSAGQSRGGYDRYSKQEVKKKQETKRKLEPSLKWKILEVDDEKDKKNEKKKDEKQVTMVDAKRTESSQKMAVKQFDDEDEDSAAFDESSSESDDDEETMDRRPEATADLPSEYWQIQKLIKYLKGGDQKATIIAICSLLDYDLEQETCQLAIRDMGGLEVLINLLDTDQPMCKIGTLKVLREVSKNPHIRRSIADRGALEIMVRILRDPNKELKCLAAETIANVAKFRRARRSVRQHHGIKYLVALLKHSDVEVARCGALALWSCSKSERNKGAMRRAGAIPLLARLLKSSNVQMLVPVVGTLQECASDPDYRLAIRTEGMIEDLVRNLKSSSAELQTLCASALFKCAESKKTRDLIRKYRGLDPLVELIKKADNKELLAAATGAIWKCAISPENVARFQQLGAIELLVGLLSNQPEEVLVNVVGALAELAKDATNRTAIRKANGLPPLVALLTGTNCALLVNVTKAVGRCAEDQENMLVIDKLDGVRLLWSLLKNQNQAVQASAAWAICPCIENTKDAGEMVRSFVGGLELIVSLLRSDSDEVLSAVCAAIANIASDEENLAVITDHGVVPMLTRLTPTTNDKLRRHLAEAIARCCNWGNNRVVFGREDAVPHLVTYLKSEDSAVHRSTARALHQLSKDPDNCITMHDSGVVKPLLELIGSDDTTSQEAAAGCLCNIRRLAMANERAAASKKQKKR